MSSRSHANSPLLATNAADVASGASGNIDLTRSRSKNCVFKGVIFGPNTFEVHRDRNPVNGLVAAAALSFSANPISRASRPASIAFLNAFAMRTGSEEHTSELQSLRHLVCRLLLEKKKKIYKN